MSLSPHFPSPFKNELQLLKKSASFEHTPHGFGSGSLLPNGANISIMSEKRLAKHFCGQIFAASVQVDTRLNM